MLRNNEEWWRVRSRVQTPMMRPKNISYYLPAMDHVALDFMDRISTLRNSKNEVPENFQNELYKWALESVGVVALNRRLGYLSPHVVDKPDSLALIEAVNEIFELVNWLEGVQLWRIFETPAFKRLKKCHQIFVEIADANILQTEAELLKHLEAQKEGNQDEDEKLTLMEELLNTPGLSRKDVVTIILDMLFAGIDTTSHTIGFTLYRLARNPEVQKRAQEEVDRVVGKQEEPLTVRQMGQLSFVKAVIKETLRMNPLTLGTARYLEQDTELGGYLIPKGWNVLGFNLVASMSEKYFLHADKFLPERWLRHQPLGPIHPFASLPFSHGTRMCIGRRIAEQELYTILTRILQRYTVKYYHKDIGVVTRLVFVPSEPLKFTFVDRP
ncbi:putative cytochrome P450 49a1 [Oratosquilla oratoria]|uniref:putative cytochrome P450 49a1 n=1 Tax=Oratosquilla oratoria TaxID=337810 RepID=UPI003F76F044